MDKKNLHYIHKRLSRFHAWYFLVIALFFLCLAIVGLRQNYSTMVTLRQAVYEADEKNGDVEKALQQLRQHVHGHMNTNLSSGSNAIKPPIQLKARYNRLVAAEEERIKAANAGVTATAETICGQRFPAGGFNAPRVACIQEYVEVNAQKPNIVPDALYKFDFITPRWSPDLAGWSLLGFGLFTILFISRLITERWLKRQLHH